MPRARLNPNPFGEGTYDPFGWELKRLVEALSIPVWPENRDDLFVRWLLPSDERRPDTERFRLVHDDRILGRLDLHPSFRAFTDVTEPADVSGFVLLARFSRWLRQAKHRDIDFVRFVDAPSVVEYVRLDQWPVPETLQRHVKTIAREARLPGTSRSVRQSLTAVEVQLTLLLLGL